MTHYEVGGGAEEGGLLKRLQRMIMGQSKQQQKTNEYDFENPEPYQPPRFDSADPAAAAYFKQNGYVVIKSVANKEQQATAIGLWWDLAEKQRPELSRKDPASWKDENWVASTSVGIMSGYGIGQSEFAWYSRLLPGVKEAFVNIWGTDDLLVSYDGCGVFRPPEQDPKWRTHGGWYHIDQNLYKRSGLHAIQGLVNYFHSGPYDGGFVVAPKSHLMMQEAFERIPDLSRKTGGDYFRTPSDLSFWVDARNAILKREEINRYDLLPVKLILEAGDLVLWDSRTIHCNHPAVKEDKNSRDRLKRLASYICMTPASLAQDMEQLAKYRILAFQKGITTTHWPHEFYPSWISKDKLPGVGADVVKLTPEQATLITGKKLAWDVYDEKLVEGVNLDALFK